MKCYVFPHLGVYLVVLFYSLHAGQHLSTKFLGQGLLSGEIFRVLLCFFSAKSLIEISLIGETSHSKK